MLTNLAKRDVVVSGVGETRDFTIKANGKAFKVLIDGLYSDKIRAVIRELWTNAFDAHVAVGTPELPFECQLPTVFEPVFRVRDFGVSLAHEDVMGLYTTVFESTKDGTNTQVGKLGLGSKSPFAYVDTFGVTAWLGGEKRVYSAFIGEDYVPRIALLRREPSEEPRGLEVSFPCKSIDVDAFEAATRKVALGFDVKPNIVGRSIEFAALETVMADEPLWRLVKSDDGRFNTRVAYARQGCVVYPIDAGAIPGASALQAGILRSAFFIDFPIGELEIAANREALGYDERTCRNILRAVDIIADGLRARYEAQIAACATYWMACREYVKLSNSSLHDGIKAVLAKGLVWRGRKLTTEIHLQQHLVVGACVGLHLGKSQLQRRRAIKWEPSSYARVYPASTIIYIEDSRSRISLAGPRIRYHFDNHRPSFDSDLAWFKTDLTSRAWKRLYVAMGRPPVVLVNELERPPAEKGYGMRAPVRMRVLAPNGYFFQQTDIDPDDAIVYVPLEHGAVISPRGVGSMTPRAVFVAREFLVRRNLLPHDVQIIGVPRSCARQCARNEHWRNLWDVARDAVRLHFDPKAAAREAACREVTTDARLAFIAALHGHGAAPADSKAPAYRLLRLFASVKARADAAEEQRHWLAFAQNIDAVALPRYAVRWELMADAFDAAYPLLPLVQCGKHLNDVARLAMLAYVNLIDGSR